jgi:hypothetical protein
MRPTGMAVYRSWRYKSVGPFLSSCRLSGSGVLLTRSTKFGALTNLKATTASRCEAVGFLGVVMAFGIPSYFVNLTKKLAGFVCWVTT